MKKQKDKAEPLINKRKGVTFDNSTNSNAENSLLLSVSDPKAETNIFRTFLTNTPNKKFIRNGISTSKYTWYSFFPKNLLH